MIMLHRLPKAFSKGGPTVDNFEQFCAFLKVAMFLMKKDNTNAILFGLERCVPIFVQIYFEYVSFRAEIDLNTHTHTPPTHTFGLSQIHKAFLWPRIVYLMEGHICFRYLLYTFLERGSVLWIILDKVLTSALGVQHHIRNIWLTLNVLTFQIFFTWYQLKPTLNIHTSLFTDCYLLFDMIYQNIKKTWS